MIDVGQNVGNYNITAKLGEGGMGTVFLAEHPVIGSKVALKAIHPAFGQNAEAFARFVNEAKAVNQIGHDHIIDITDFGIAATGDCYIMMEYLEGDTLSGSLERSGAFPPARALNIAGQIADALGASHDHGIIHRDLKPANIFLIARDGTQDFVKVLDFGLAKLTHADELGMYPSRAVSVMGTPYYMSPEQCEGRIESDHRGDVYALGVMLFEMLTGIVPFGGDGYGEILAKHMTVQSPAARSLVPDLSPALDLILFRALSKAPGDRFQSMSDFQKALQDPEGYASGRPDPDAYKDMTDGTGSALPLVRTEMKFQPPRASSQPEYVEGLGKAPSMFRDSLGEVWVREGEPKPARHRGQIAMLLGLALAGVAVVGMRFKKEARRFVTAVVAPSKPPTFRVDINSEPDGATVVRADGTILGVTPLSTDLTNGDARIEFVIRLEGYLPMNASVLPDWPSPVFVALRRDDPAPTVELAVPEVEIVPEVPVIGALPPVAKKSAAMRSARRRRAWQAVDLKHAPDSDPDETLQLSEP